MTATPDSADRALALGATGVLREFNLAGVLSPADVHVASRLTALLEESDGAQVVFPPGFTNREGDPLPLIVRSRAGAFTYGTSDLACVLDRVERVGATRLLYVVDAGQAQHFAMVFAVAAMAGWLELPARAEHVAFSGVHVLRELTRARGEQVVAPVVFTSALGLGELFDAGVRREFGDPV